MMNVYDLEGNYREWTAEAANSNARTAKGGYWFSSYYAGNFEPASGPYNGYISTSTEDRVATRTTLYL